MTEKLDKLRTDDTPCRFVYTEQNHVKIYLGDVQVGVIVTNLITKKYRAILNLPYLTRNNFTRTNLEAVKDETILIIENWLEQANLKAL